ncbi:hypothetical protein DH09_19310 [Bacillaceae bacterium JMAK1]|nr:hypothetical protein DH09_19310 [Bacillaceae bacterium JMAK1]
MKKRSVCMLISEHPYEDARIFEREAKSLVNAGYNVTMLVPHFKGKLLGVDGNFLKKKVEPFCEAGVTMIPYEATSLQSRFTYDQTKEHTSTLAIRGMEIDADVYHAHELSSLVAAVQIKRKKPHIKVIFDSHELVIDARSKTSNRRQRQYENVFRELLKDVDALITVSPSIAKDCYDHGYKGPSKLIYNAPRLSSPPNLKQSIRTIGYVGTVTKEKGNWHKLLELASLSDFHFKVIGGATRFTEPLDIPKKLQNRIHIRGWVPYANIAAELKDVDVGWIDMDLSTALNRDYALPNKFFSYLDAGVPVLVNRCKDMRNFIEHHTCGASVPKSVASAQDYLKQLSLMEGDLMTFSRNARNVMETTASWENMEIRLIELYGALFEQS